MHGLPYFSFPERTEPLHTQRNHGRNGARAALGVLNIVAVGIFSSPCVLRSRPVRASVTYALCGLHFLLEGYFQNFRSVRIKTRYVWNSLKSELRCRLNVHQYLYSYPTVCDKTLFFTSFISCIIKLYLQ